MWPLLIIVTVLAAVAQGVAGFGFTLLSVSFYLLILRSTEAVQLVLLMNFAIALVLVGRLWRHIPVRPWAFLAGGGLVGFPAGLWLYTRADVALIEMGIAAVTIAFALFVLAAELRAVRRDDVRSGAKPFHPAAAATVGVTAGALTSSLGAPGPPVAIYLSALGLDKTTFRALAQGTFIVMQMGSIAGQAYTVGIGAGVWRQAFLLAPVAALGSAAGHRLSRHVGERDFRRAVLLLLLATGAYMLVHGLHGALA